MSALLFSEFRQIGNNERNKSAPKKQQIAPKNAVIKINEGALPEKTRNARITPRLKIPRSVKYFAQADLRWVTSDLAEGYCAGADIGNIKNRNLCNITAII